MGNQDLFPPERAEILDLFPPGEENQDLFPEEWSTKSFSARESGDPGSFSSRVGEPRGLFPEEW